MGEEEGGRRLREFLARRGVDIRNLVIGDWSLIFYTTSLWIRTSDNFTSLVIS